MGRPANETNIKNVADLVALGRADLPSFSRWPLGYTGEYSLWNCQKDWQNQAQESYKAKLANPIDNPFLCLLAPSEHGKTYGLDIPFILWALARNRNLRIGVVSSKDDLAANIGHGIDRIFKTRGDKLKEFGLVPATPWNAYTKFVERDDDKLIHPSIMFLGPDTEVQGVRFDIIFLSDFATFKNQRTPEARRKLMDWVLHSLFPRLEPWGHVIAEGHHVDPDDIYSEFEEAEDEWKVIKYRAIIDEPSESTGGKANLLAPEQWTYKQLNRIRQRDSRVFQLIYQNVPVARTGMVSREALERGLDRGRSLQLYCTPEIRASYDKIALSIDPAFTVKRYSSYSVCLAWGITKSGHRDLLGGWRDRMLAPQLRSKIVSTIHAWDPDVVYLEANAAQIFFLQEVRAQLGTKADRVKPVYSLSNNPEESVEHLMGTFVSKVESGMVTFPYMGQDAQSLVEQLFIEITNYPTGKTSDVAMACNILENGLQKEGTLERKTIKIKSMGAWRGRSGFPGRIA